MKKWELFRFKLKAFWYTRPAALRAFIILLGIIFWGFFMFFTPGPVGIVTLLFFVWFAITQIIKTQDKYR